jgi:hypothetical protein
LQSVFIFKSKRELGQDKRSPAESARSGAQILLPSRGGARLGGAWCGDARLGAGAIRRGARCGDARLGGAIRRGARRGAVPLWAGRARARGAGGAALPIADKGRPVNHVVRREEVRLVFFPRLSGCGGRSAMRRDPRGGGREPR